MTAKQGINLAKKSKDIQLLIIAYENYYREQREKPDHTRITEIEAMPERLQKVILVNILKRKLLGITRETANSIIKHFFKTRVNRSSGLYGTAFYNSTNKHFNAKELLKECAL